MNNIRFFIVSLMLCMFVFTTCTTPIPKAHTASQDNDTVTIPLDFFGMVHAGHKETSEEYVLLNQMGVEWILHTFYWGDIEPEKGNFVTSSYDSRMNLAKENNKKVIAVIGYETHYVFAQTGKRRYIPNEFLPDFLNYVEFLATHFKGKVDAWQIWNEANALFWNGTNAEFFEMSKQAAQRIRETDPEAYIIGGGFFRVPRNFIRGMHRAGAFENLDALSFHPYAMNPRSTMVLHDDFTKLLSELNFTGDVWITEAGYPTGGWYPFSVSHANLPSHVIKTISGAAIRGTKVLCWYEMFDHHTPEQVTSNFDSEQFFGLVYPDYSRKEGSFAYELCARYLPGSKYQIDPLQRVNVPSNIVTYCFMEGARGRNTLIIWNDRNNPQRIKISLQEPMSIHDISTGSDSILDADSILTIRSKPVFITWEGSSKPTISGVR